MWWSIQEKDAAENHASSYAVSQTDQKRGSDLKKSGPCCLVYDTAVYRYFFAHTFNNCQLLEDKKPGVMKASNTVAVTK